MQAAGTAWNNDSGNWSRAFHSTKPPDVTVTHSKYWRSAHWTYEFEYFFEIEPNEAFKKHLFVENKLRQITGDEAAKIRKDSFGEPPSWSAPRDVAEYEVWVLEGESSSNFKILIDRKSGAIFLNDYLV